MQLTSEQQHQRMTQTPIPQLVVSLALPTTLSQIVTVVYNTADTYFVAQIGTSAAAAVGVVFALMSIIQAFGFGVGMGANSLISRRLGEKKDEEACCCASSALAASLCFGLLLMVGGLLFLKPLLLALGSTNTILPYACDYARFILLGAPVMCMSCVLNSVLRAEGEATLSMLGLCAGGLLNMALDPLLIFVCGMGTAGASLATMLSQLFSFLILTAMFLRGKSIIRLAPKWVSRNARVYGEIFRAGIPTVFRQSMGSLSTALLNVQAAAYGDAAVAAITIANKVYMLCRNIVLGIGQGFQPCAGYNYGAGNKKRVRQAFKFSCLLGTGVCIAAAVAIHLQAATILSWFRNDTEVIRIGTVALQMLCVVLPLLAYSTFVNQMYQSLGFAVRATILACCRQGICFVPLVLLLPRVFGLTGVAMAQPGADLLTALISIPFQIYFYRKVLPCEPARACDS